MAKIGLIDNLDYHLFSERVAVTEDGLSPTKDACKDAQANLSLTLKNIKASKDIGLILQAEHGLLENERQFYSNTPEMDKSLDNAISEIKGAHTTYAKVHDPVQYREIDQSHQSHANRSGALPKDEVRQFFDRNSARILNLGKARLTESEKEVLNARRDNMIAGRTAYIALQKQALGIEPTPSKAKGAER